MDKKLYFHISKLAFPRFIFHNSEKIGLIKKSNYGWIVWKKPVWPTNSWLEKRGGSTKRMSLRYKTRVNRKILSQLSKI